MGKIITKDISWLYSKEPLLQHIIESNSEILKTGYIAGGFLFRSLNGELASFLKDKETANGIFYSSFRGDIDFFFYEQQQSVDEYNSFCKSQGILRRLTSLITNSPGGFAFEVYGPLFDAQIKYQFINKNFGTPEEVLSRFDIANTKIATDGKVVWMDEDWEELHSKKIVRVDNYSGKYILSRLAKYLNPEYTIDKNIHDSVLAIMLQGLKEDRPYAKESVKKILENKNSIDKEYISMFHNKIGKMLVKQDGNGLEPEGYSESNLTREYVDMANYILQNRKELEELKSEVK